jgi:enamine deaminase RidA (YjgF/YER057c/UK114 family)
MPKERINPDSLFPSRQYGFSQIVVSQGSKTIYISGQVAWDEQQQIVGPGDLRKQTRQALQNVKTAVEAAGGKMADVVSMRIYVVWDHLQESAAIRDGLHEFFPDHAQPATTWIGVHSLANRDFLIEIEPIAVTD